MKNSQKRSSQRHAPNAGPQVNRTSLERDLEGAPEEQAAFEGFEPTRSMAASAATSRPGSHGRATSPRSWLNKLSDSLRRLFKR
jgi:hypothetical protein